MKTYTDADRYQALRKVAVISSHDVDRADALFLAAGLNEHGVSSKADFDAGVDRLCAALEFEPE